MDKEEARFILRCFRPDGADAENPDFAEALAWAAKDRELGEWLARERARDADFASALSSVSRKPSASSASWPGVRIVTATGWPSITICSGSSITT